MASRQERGLRWLGDDGDHERECGWKKEGVREENFKKQKDDGKGKGPQEIS
ncbi:hypothetical protein SESBI_39143 [Sesbania bispinosa]|nr:hypothetical protein SESBI_39143 [Sesbania bispinosa]